MEEKKKTNSNIMVIILCVLLVIALAVIGILYCKLAKANSNSATDYKTNLSKTIKDLSAEGYKVKRVAYLSEKDEGYNKNGITGAYIDEKDDAYILFKADSELYTLNGDKYKVDEDVACVYSVSAGNGGFSDFIFIKNDGTVYKLSTAIQDRKIEYKAIEGAKDAVTIVPYLKEDIFSGVGELGYILVDINGNKI